VYARVTEVQERELWFGQASIIAAPNERLSLLHEHAQVLVDCIRQTLGWGLFRARFANLCGDSLPPSGWVNRHTTDQLTAN